MAPYIKSSTAVNVGLFTLLALLLRFTEEPGICIVMIQFLGGLLNQYAVHCNGGRMPVINLGCTTDRHKHLDANTRLKILCDVIQFQYRTMSVGDVFIYFSFGLHPLNFLSKLQLPSDRVVGTVLGIVFGCFLGWIILLLFVWFAFVCSLFGRYVRSFYTPNQ